VSERELDAGPELDALVAERVMGWTRQPDGRWDLPEPHPLLGAWTYGKPLEYSSDIAAAWQVVSAVTEKTGCLFTLTMSRAIRREGKVPVWSAYFEVPGPIEGRKSYHGGFHDTPALAVCKSALVALATTSDTGRER
jgi:hypothetical protein